MRPSKTAAMPGRDCNQWRSQNCFKLGSVLLRYFLTFQKDYSMSSWICVTLQLKESDS